jgi:hypothetical protein
MNSYEIINSDSAEESIDSVFTREEMYAMIASANANLLPERQIDPLYALLVAERVYSKTHGLHNTARNFAIRKAVSGHIELMSKGMVASASGNYDLLPIEHPLSTAATELSYEEIRDARAEWIAADTTIDENIRPLISSTYKQEQGTLERMHAEMRLMALTNAGKISPEVSAYVTPIVASAEIAPFTDADLVYWQARSEALELLNRQSALTASAGISIDPTGLVARMVYRGETSKSILSVLKSNQTFRQSLSLLDQDLADADPMSQAAQTQFAALYASISSLPEASSPVDLKAIAASAIKRYDDEAGTLAEVVEAGASAEYIFSLLEDNEAWASDFAAWIESDSEETPVFASVYWTVADLDYADASFRSYDEVFPASK